MLSTLKVVVAIGAGVMAVSQSAQAQSLVTQKAMPLAMAQTIANGAMEACKAMGYKVSVAVVDRAGLTMVMLRGDGAGLHTPEGAERKAYTAQTPPVQRATRTWHRRTSWRAFATRSRVLPVVR